MPDRTIPIIREASVEQTTLSILAILLVRFAFELFPVDQFDRRRNHAHQRRTLDGFKPFATARHRLIAARELERLAAGGFDLQHLAFLGNDRTADAAVVVLQFDADDALADAGEYVDLADREMDDMVIRRREEDAFLLAQQNRRHDNLVLFVEPNVAPTELVRRGAIGCEG